MKVCLVVVNGDYLHGVLIPREYEGFDENAQGKQKQRVVVAIDMQNFTPNHKKRFIVIIEEIGRTASMHSEQNHH